jgi:ATP-binding cassette, subfamily G (WHITE), member 2, PDR
MSYLGGGGISNYDASLAQGGASALPPSKGRHQPEEAGMHRVRSGQDSDAVEEARRDSEVHELAREITRKSTFSEADLSPLEAGPDSRLNPNSPRFNAKAWAKALLKLRQQDDKNPMRTAGVAFRNLNVYGFGTATDYQRTVANVLLQAIGIFRKIAGIGQHRIDILQNFEGVIRAGEMLVVLGPPGSGCTTFLKTISGETHGFHVDKGSYLNYQGRLR